MLEMVWERERDKRGEKKKVCGVEKKRHPRNGVKQSDSASRGGSTGLGEEKERGTEHKGPPSDGGALV